MTPTDLLAAGFRMGGGLLHRMVDDLTPDEWHRQPVPGANSAAWVVGHLALTLRNGLRRLGATDLPEFPADLEARFQVTRQAAGDQSGAGDPKVLLPLFDALLDRMAAHVRTLPADLLVGASDYPGPFAANRGEAILFGSLHIAMHGGQLSTLRRSLGKPPIV